MSQCQSEEVLAQNEGLLAAWDVAAEALEEDPMRPVRYAKCFQYLRGTLEGARILEVGCGEGTGLMLLRRLGFHNSVGVEVSAERLKRAAAKLPAGVHLRQISPSGQLPFENDSFDVVITAAVIEHALDREQFIIELARVTQPGGLVIVSSDCYSWRILQALGIYKSLQPIDLAPFPLKLVREFERSGLTLLHCEGFPLPGQEYRFFRLLVARPVSLAKHLIKSAVRVVWKKAWVRGPVPQKLQVASPADAVAPVTEGGAWKPTHLFASLPRLILSDENVFLLRKQ